MTSYGNWALYRIAHRFLNFQQRRELIILQKFEFQFAWNNHHSITCIEHANEMALFPYLVAFRELYSGIHRAY